ncbi:CARDB domain-containing protein [Haloplanus sp.]|uniref:CARDB domain-containing protein n=1 Tax=Haloplanus sp. TaxID=1961696 RepID=UPI00262B5FBC|nr:CARDB domain-containing protein [Haloplanus sp.]
MNRGIVRLVVVVAALSAATLAIGTGGSILSGPTDPVSEDVTLSPASGPNGDYAYLADGELVVDLTPANPTLDGDGPSDDGVTTLDDVFVIHYGGDRFARVWLTHDSESVGFRADGDPIQSEANAVFLPANESASVGLRINTTGTTDGLVEDITVHARVADPEDVGGTSTADPDADSDSNSNSNSNTGANPDRASDGSDDDERSIRSFSPNASTRTFIVTNAPLGAPVALDTDRLVLDGTGTRTLTLDELVVTGDATAMSVDLRVIDEPETVDAGPGVTPLGALESDDDGAVTEATFRFSVAPGYLDDHGTTFDSLVVRHTDGTEWRTLDIAAGGTRDGRTVFEVEAPRSSALVVGARTPALRVVEAGIDRTTAAPGESASVTASVRNDGRAAGERTVSLTVDGDRVATRTVTLSPGETATIRFDVSTDAPGRYVVGVDGTDAGTLVVEAGPSTATPADTPVSTARPTDDTTPPTRTSDPVGEAGGFPFPVIVGLVGLLVALFVVLLVARRRDGGD